MNEFNLKFDITKIKYYADQYQYQNDSDLKKIGNAAKNKNYLTKEEFVRICAWKTPRSKLKVAKNTEEYIKEITSISFTTNSDQLKIEVLTLLNGVGWPTASTILHFCHREEFPILDFRALFSLGIDPVTQKYNFEFWNEYVNYCRNLSKVTNLDLRTIDKGLWQYSKTNSSL